MLVRARKSRCTRIANLRGGDANTKFFHRCINACRRKNHIHQIKHELGLVIEHNEKEKIIHDHFYEVLGRGGGVRKGVHEQRGL